VSLATVIFKDGYHQGACEFKQTLNEEQMGALSTTFCNYQITNYRFVVARTNTFSNFCQDFFFPTFFHQVVKVRRTVDRIFSYLASLLNDLATLPIRFITLIPRIIYNTIHGKKEHPLYQYLLVQEGVPQALLNCDRIHVGTQVGANPILFKTCDFVPYPCDSDD